MVYTADEGFVLGAAAFDISTDEVANFVSRLVLIFFTS